MIHPVYSADGSVSAVSHQQMSRFSANLPSAHFLTQTKDYISPPGPEQGKLVIKSTYSAGPLLPINIEPSDQTKTNLVNIDFIFICKVFIFIVPVKTQTETFKDKLQLYFIKNTRQAKILIVNCCR